MQEQVTSEAKDSGLIYIAADKYIEELKDLTKGDFALGRMYRKSAKKALKRRIAWGPDAVCLIDTESRQFVK